MILEIYFVFIGVQQVHSKIQKSYVYSLIEFYLYVHITNTQINTQKTFSFKPQVDTNAQKHILF